MQNLFEAIQPDLTLIFKTLISILTMFVLYALRVLQKRLMLWIDSRQSVSERELLHKIAGEAFAIAEKTVTGSNTKFNTAFSYTSEMLGKAKIKISPEEIRAAVEKSVLDYNSKVKTGVEYKKSS